MTAHRRAAETWLLDGWRNEVSRNVEVKGDLYAAQSLLLDTFALLDDLDMERIPVPLHARITMLLRDVGFFLELRPWQPEPSSNPQTGIDRGLAPDVA